MADRWKTGCVFRWKFSMPCAPPSLPDRPVTMRLSGTDWIDGGWTIEESDRIRAGRWKSAAAPGIHVSSGGLCGGQSIPVGPGYQVALARQVKQAVKEDAGHRRRPHHRLSIRPRPFFAAGDADLIALARAMLYNPPLALACGGAFRDHVRAPDQYLRSQPHGLKDLFDMGGTA